MGYCKLCRSEIHGSEGRVFCKDTKCKEIFKEIKHRMRKQRLEYRLIMKIQCTTCKKQLSKGEDKYCSVCADRLKREKKHRAETDNFRPCKDCGVAMKNPAGNRKWCNECSEKKKNESRDEQVRKRKEVSKRMAAKRAKRKKEVKVAVKPNTKLDVDQDDRYEGTVNPKWLTRGTIRSNQLYTAIGA